ncbi:cytochrome b [Pseudomonas typographi]|uniref:cytochrome b n=1 Tax=Pseudomonas typographi TaxID=2715964 RepID=UPI001682B2B5|nr:cytochrome b [Pseudomonas typographi]MBD1588144.1 cytochrome b [Pseudomonas typographi]
MHSEHYTATAKWLHWVMAAIWLGAWLLGFCAAHWHAINSDHQVTFVHKALASSVLFLVVLRVAWRLTHSAPALPASISPLMRKAAHYGHLLLYAVALIALPVSGWLWSSAGNHEVWVLGLLKLPPLVAPAESTQHLAGLFHTYVAWLCGALVGGHILVALKHHFVDRDGVLRGMLPR